MNIGSHRFAVPLGLALTLALPARANDQPSSPPGGGGGLGLLGSPDVTLRAGVVLPVFLTYELPGPMLGLTLAWPRGEPLQVIARAELGALFFDGAQRYLGNLGVGARLTPWRDGSVAPWLQLGLGTLGHVEHISVVLPERVVSDTDVGGSFSVDAAIGAEQRREPGVRVEARLVRRWHDQTDQPEG